ncbi:carbonic anhydrase family protein [Entomomonas moraniae]|uniref:carbonic anhydrase family protein n=1 Tax=Entomomonas moraniae TaxID=2213226 RepID=UPI00225DE37E|nr:carbonic anhydrase family protein [Entomomonas moraniae]
MEQFHFHTPSENLLNGNSYPIEMHFVHTNKEGQLAVVAVMATVGEANPTINKIINLSPKGINDVNRIEETLQLETLLPKDTHYYRYSGSLTTPPCSEGVIWIVMKQFTKMSKEQIQELTTLLNSKNNRPPQPLNGRQIVEL